jgi:hypothetical protein
MLYLYVPWYTCTYTCTCTIVVVVYVLEFYGTSTNGTRVRTTRVQIYKYNIISKTYLGTMALISYYVTTCTGVRTTHNNNGAVIHHVPRVCIPLVHVRRPQTPQGTRQRALPARLRTRQRALQCVCEDTRTRQRLRAQNIWPFASACERSQGIKGIVGI